MFDYDYYSMNKCSMFNGCMLGIDLANTECERTNKYWMQHKSKLRKKKK